MHDDEVRSQETLRAQILSEALVNRDALLAQMTESVAVDIDGEEVLSGGFGTSGSARTPIQRAVAAESQVAEQLRDIEHLQSALAKIQDSRSYKLGRAALFPYRFLKRARRALRNPAALRRKLAGGVGRRKQNPPKTPPTSGQRIKRLASANDLSRRLQELWISEGAVSAAIRLVDENPALVAQLDPAGLSIVRRLQGAQRLQESLLQIPPRSAGVAYLPEPDRIMYAVHSTPAFNSNGYSTRTHGLARGLRANGADVTVVGRAGYPWDARPDRPLPPERRLVSILDDIRYVHLPGSGLHEVGIDHYMIEAADAFVREAKLLRPSVMQAASNYRTAIPALIAARRVGIPFIYEVRGLWELTEASARDGWADSERFALMVALETQVATEADAVLAITQEVADELVRRGVDPARISITPNGVNTDDFLPLPTDSEYGQRQGIRADVPVIGFAGSLVPYEGLDTLLDASELLAKRGIAHQVVIAGSGPSESELHRRAANSKNRVKMLGRLPMHEMPRLFSLFDIMPVPRHSTPVTELVSPLKPLESFSAGKAVIFSDIAPHRTLAGIDGQRAMLVPASNSEQLAIAIAELIENPDTVARMGREARLWTLEERTWRHIGAGIQRVIANLLTHTQPATGRSATSLRVGLIADEFTTSTLSGTFEVVPLDRKTWRTQLDRDNLDLVFVESAWAGNDGTWTRAVGYYGEEENRDLFALIDDARERGIPSVFWNKEDPVHFSRFERTAARFDHVFTTDASMIPHYLQSENSQAQTVSSLPFYAQPAIHNPLASTREFEATVAYAGTYYGDRYAKRSAELSSMLQAALPFGLAIYDRQADLPDSPYRFPEHLQQYVRGSLPYEEVLKSYKSHLAHLNVNSVAESPSMFSRRVVEIAASGGLVLSGPGRGVSETFGGTIPAFADETIWRALLRSWSSDAPARVREAWLQMRSVYRSHTARTALSLVARTAGIPVDVPEPPRYALLVDGADSPSLQAILRQSLPPTTVLVTGSLELASAALENTQITVVDAGEILQSPVDWIGIASPHLERTHFEDLLIATHFGDWDRIVPRTATADDLSAAIAVPIDQTTSEHGLVAIQRLRDGGSLSAALSGSNFRGIQLLLAPQSEETTAPISDDLSAIQRRTVLFAGHDLKFVTPFMDYLRATGHEVLIDEWGGHNVHDESKSLALLEQAEVVFCEWGLGNAHWYSERVRDDQRLIVRVHSQELRRPFLRSIKHERVDRFIFVGELIRRAAVISHGVPLEKSVVIPNAVDTSALALPKSPEAKYNLGLVGLVPRSKRLDLAVQLLEMLLEQDSRYRLHVKGKRPEEYAWMTRRRDEMSFYDAVYSKIDQLERRHPGCIVFDEHGDDMPQWFQKIGIALSVSDFESFHLTLPDGAASGAMPVSLAWPGADLIYPTSWLHPTIKSMADAILEHGSDPTAEAGEFVAQHFDSPVVMRLLADVTFG